MALNLANVQFLLLFFAFLLHQRCPKGCLRKWSRRQAVLGRQVQSSTPWLTLSGAGVASRATAVELLDVTGANSVALIDSFTGITEGNVVAFPAQNLAQQGNRFIIAGNTNTGAMQPLTLTDATVLVSDATGDLGTSDTVFISGMRALAGSCSINVDLTTRQMSAIRLEARQ